MPELTQQSVEGTILCLDTFVEAIGEVVNEEKTEFFLIGQDAPS
jgi:hypothetical protein